MKHIIVSQCGSSMPVRTSLIIGSDGVLDMYDNVVITLIYMYASNVWRSMGINILNMYIQHIVDVIIRYHNIGM